MKKIVLFCALHLVLAHSLYAMELQPVFIPHKTTTTTSATATTTHSLEALVSTVDTEIQKQYKIESSFGGFITQRVLPHHLASTSTDITHAVHVNNIISIIQTHNSSPSDEFIAALYEKNTVVKTIVDHYASLAYKDIKNVTYNTLEAIEHPALGQPTAQLNILPLAIKTYVMNRAKTRHISANCARAFNPDTNYYFNMSKSGLFATVSHRGLQLWNFNKTEQGENRLCSTYPSCSCFNADGSCIAIAEISNNQTSIKEWNSETLTLNFDIQITEAIYGLAYDCNKNILIGAYRKGPNVNQILYSIDNNTPSHLITITIPYDQCALYYASPSYLYDNEEHIKGDYAVSKGKSSNDRLYVTKSNCIALKLCELAIKSAQKRRHLQKIKTSQSFLSLTEYEHDIITKQMEEKRKELTEELKKTRTTATNTRTRLITNNTLTLTGSSMTTTTL